MLAHVLSPSIMSDSLPPYGLWPTRILCPFDSLGQARMLEWVAMPSCRGSFQPRDWIHVSYISCIGRWVLYHWATWEAPREHNSDCHILQSRRWCKAEASWAKAAFPGVPVLRVEVYFPKSKAETRANALGSYRDGNRGSGARLPGLWSDSQVVVWLWPFSKPLWAHFPHS